MIDLGYIIDIDLDDVDCGVKWFDMLLKTFIPFSLLSMAVFPCYLR